MPRSRVTLSDVDRPPDTSSLVPCADADSASAIEAMRRRLLKRRRSLLERAESRRDRTAVDRIVAALRRLHNPHLAAYKTESYVLLSEPFNGVASAVRRAPYSVADRAARVMFGSQPPARVVRVLAEFGEPALNAALNAGVRITMVPEGRGFSEFSPAVARLVPGVDAWSAPPSGLFVVEERRVLLRSRALSMTAAHEFAHALDAALARRPRSYFSYESEEVRFNFSTATGFVNEYAASGLDEYFAESVRAYLEINDSRCAWLPLTRYDLLARDPRMFALVERLFRSKLAQRERRIASRCAARVRHSDPAPSPSPTESALPTVCGSK
jgi:hypothetical protein